ncbi:helicase DnaB [Rodentibacter caecimuris]|uniref:DNA 5'-3' helicase n=2 Tax=Rodentibacter caecimuris TaxID=1796644 RepID=A0AAJ3K4W3_9PAST|nr:DnaB-like helicase C-terminal domain-containing protein [Rodentibacter heylii]AOF54455.1 Replicative DNA helicase [Pasteurellaceae bacterium NI1060]OOF72362.1 helicase DnaB [Rodentibacter heylii]OOF73373.1 helicase DnaB [Rodentibacter heylii]OOF75737.1 helicase DnaB [Rodentibacter heylii]
MTTGTVKIIPHDVTAEQMVLGALMLAGVNERTNPIFGMLKPESFYTYAHQRIFAEMRALAQANKPIDLLTLEHSLKSKGISEDVGGFAYLAEISNNTASAGNVKAYAEIVRSEAVKRFTLSKLQDCEALIFEQNGAPVEARLETISRLMSEIADYSREGKVQGLRRGRDVGNDWLNDYQTRLLNPESVRGLSSGLSDLDRLLGSKGLVRQSLAVVGARPKCGKTAFYSLMAENCILNEKKPVLLFSLEMSGKAIFERMISKRADVNSHAFYESQQNEEAFNEKYHLYPETFNNKVASAVGDLVNGDLLYIDDTPGVSMAHIRNECRRIKRERGEIGLIGVDYLTLMKAEKAERNDLAYGQITKELKNLAREMDCVVLLLTQLNRNLESRADKRPLPSDSRDTGQIEQECDYWFGLYKESVYNENADPYLTEVMVRLNRHGGTGKVYVDQKFGAMFECDQLEAERRAEMGKPDKKQPRYKKTEKDEF